MASGTWTTTADEDAAILALTVRAADLVRGDIPETVQEFITRHIRHQVEFAVSQAKEAVQAAYDKLPAAEKAKIDAILDANTQKGGKL